MAQRAQVLGRQVDGQRPGQRRQQLGRPGPAQEIERVRPLAVAAVYVADRARKDRDAEARVALQCEPSDARNPMLASAQRCLRWPGQALSPQRQGSRIR